MCKFFSFMSFAGKFCYCDWKKRQELLASNPESFKPDSHASIAKMFGFDEDKCNKYEYNPLTGVFTVDQINAKDDSRSAENWIKSLDFNTIVEPLIIKKIIHPFRDFDRTDVTKDEIELLKQWDSVLASVLASVGDSVLASVGDSVWVSVGDSVLASVGDSVWVSVGDSVLASVGDSVWVSVGDSVLASVGDSVWVSVGDSVWASVWAYISSFFRIDYKYDFSSCVKLWESGLVPSFNGKTWRLHGGKDGKILYEANGAGNEREL